MRISYLATVVAVLALTTGAHAGHRTPGGFLKGSTTVAEVEQGLGAPMDTTMKSDGALTLIYQANRLSDASADAKTVALHFDTDFVLRDATVTAVSSIADNGLASR
jgi:hypothetical protein